MSTDINQVLRDWQARSIGIVENVVGIKPDSASRMSFLGAHCTYLDIEIGGKCGYISKDEEADGYASSFGTPGGQVKHDVHPTFSEAVDWMMREVFK